MDLSAYLFFRASVDRVGRVGVADERDAIPATLRFANGRVDAVLGVHAADDETIGLQSREHVREIRLAERIAQLLVDDRVAFRGSDRGRDLPTRAVSYELAIAVPDVDHGNGARPRVRDQVLYRSEEFGPSPIGKRVDEHRLNVDNEEDVTHRARFDSTAASSPLRRYTVHVRSASVRADEDGWASAFIGGLDIVIRG